MPLTKSCSKSFLRESDGNDGTMGGTLWAASNKTSSSSSSLHVRKGKAAATPTPALTLSGGKASSLAVRGNVTSDESLEPNDAILVTTVHGPRGNGVGV